MKKRVLACISISLFIVLWQGAVAMHLVNERLTPSPMQVMQALTELIISGRLFDDALSSLARVLTGFTAASVFAIGLAVLLWSVPCLSNLVWPIVELLRPIPPIAWVPLTILWFGIGPLSACVIVAIGSAFPILLNTYLGLCMVDEKYKRAALTLGAGRFQLIRHVVLPSALPQVFTGLRLGLGTGWMCVIAAELLGAQSGLGYMIQYNRLLLHTPRVFAGMAIIGLLGFGMNGLMLAVEQKCLPWKRIGNWS
jgi:ABC-type nitrate/sulfonate/bicarbonate transport system permease component